MKPKKPGTTTAMRRLFQATKDVVDGTRKAYADAGMPGAQELRVPVLFQGTDMRVTIEAGPGVAMRNALENAQMKASDKPAKEPGLDARLEALTLLSIYASELKSMQAVNGKFVSPDDERHFNRVVMAMKMLDIHVV
jgi:hypothetical protein